ncbi:MAG: long-chain fatty acid--CoA ligase [Deltaproteobacteria bacterium]|nr:long-chain fatty acid--CoA ligase [Deltaproteobacteria bacterium]
MSFERIWHQSYAPGVPPVIEPERITIAEVLRRTASRFPDRTAFIFMGRKITFRELESLVNRFTRALAELGVRAGDKVATLLPNLPQHVIANHACYRLGAVTVMNNPLYSERELEVQLNDSDARFLITLDLLLPRTLKLKATTKIESIIPCHINDYLPFPKKQLYPFVKKAMYRKVALGPGVHPFLDLIHKQPDDPVPIAARWEDTAAFIYTGGTTGVSKGAMLTHANICGVVQQVRAWFPDLKDGEESLLGVYPIFHSAGYSVSQNLTIWGGWTCIMIPRPEPGIILEMLKKYRPGFLPGVPTIFVGLLNREDFRQMDLSFIKGFFAGAAPLAPDTVKQLQDLTGKGIYDVYGLTENTAFATCTPWKGRAKPGTVGLPLPNTDIKIVDLETGTRELPAGEAGEICIRGPQLMSGYYKKPEETANALRDGWLYSGDVGFLDEDGYLTVVDRKKDMIIASGFNIYPKEIDEILFDHPKILEACAIGVSDAYRGETIKAFVVVKPGESLTEEEIIAYCKGKLAAYKIPKIVEFIAELPKSAVGKVLRRELKEMERKKREREGNGPSTDRPKQGGE